MSSYIMIMRLRRRKRKRIALSKLILKDMKNPFSLDESEFINKFCMSQKGVLYLCELLGPIMRRRHGYPIELQVLSSLRVLRTGAYQTQAVEDQIMCISQATVSRSMDTFLDAIMAIEDQVIEFPSYGDLAFTEQKLYGQSKILNIIGAILCTHVKISKPHAADPSIYLNVDNDYSVKVQLVCDADLCILDAVIEWPGSTSTSTIWKKSPLRNILKNSAMPNKSFLVGDGSFPLEPWLLVPFEDCLKTEELIFNDHINRALRVVQMCDASVRTRFKSIHHRLGLLHYTPEKCCRIIIACFVLHNFCIKFGMHLNEPVNLDECSYSVPFYSEISSNMEETLLRNEAICIRDEVARHLS